MIWQVEWSSDAEKDLRKLPRDLVEQIIRAVNRFASSGHGDVKRLVASGGEYRLRIRDWRVRFSTDPQTKLLTVLRVLPRGSAYR